MVQRLQIQEVNIANLRPALYNPRKWPEEEANHLKESIQRFGFVDPILVNGAPNRKNIVIGGHFRLHIAKQLKYKKVPVVFISLSDEKKEKELNLRLNRNTGEWDYNLLKEFDVEILLDVGFDDSDLQHIWDDAIEVVEDHFNEKEELQKLKEPFVKEGEIYALGNHRLICSDSTSHTTFEKLLGGKKVGFITADPPYNISLNYSKGIGTKGKYGGTKVDDSKSDENYREFLRQCLSNAGEFAKLDAHFFCWCDERYIGLIQSLYQDLGVENKRVCLWVKNNQMAIPQVAFNKVYEPCIYGTIGKPFLSDYHTNFNEVLNKEIGTGNRLQGDIMDIFSIWLEKRLPATEYEHPTSKPPALYEKALRRCTKPGDTVLELFGGSGSTLIACEQLKRTCYMVELDPLFCSLIITRYEKLTGQKAQLLN